MISAVRGVPDTGERKRRRLSIMRLLFGLLLLGAAIAIITHLGDARRFAGLLRRARPAWLLLGAVLQGATYVCAGGVWWLVLRRMSSPQPLRPLMVLSVGKVFTDQALPSGGISGSTLMIRGVVRRGTPVAAAEAALVISLLGFYAAMIAATVGSLLLLWKYARVPAVLIVMAAVLLAVAVIVSTALIVLVRGGASPLRRLVAHIHPLRTLLDSFAGVPRRALHDRVSLSGSFALQLANIALDAATLQVMLAAVGEHVAPGAVFASFVFASIVEMTGLVPGGLGTFEGTCVALLHVCGVDLEPALTGTLLLRGVTFWLPMIPGVVIARRELGHDQRPR